jgi:hypothetical protein
MKTSRLLCAALALAIMAATAAAAPKTTVSVMDLNTSSGLSQKELQLLTDKLLNSLVEYRVFEVVERSKRDEILKEQGFQMTGACSDASCLVEVGQLLGAQKMIGGTIGTLGGIYVAELRMIDIKTGGIDLTFSRNYGKIADLLGAMREAAEIFSSWKPSGGGASAKPGGLFIVSEPEGARILVDGSQHPRTTPDLVYPLAEGLHQVSLVKDGYSLYSASRLVSVGKIDTLSAPLMSQAGKLRISTAPSGAKVYLGKKFQGTSTEQPMVIEDLTDTVYALKAAKRGYRTYSTVLRPSPGRETRVSAALPLQRWMAVVSGGLHVRISGAKDEATSFSPGSSSSSSEINGEGFAFTGRAGLGCNIGRSFAVSLNYQFKSFPEAIDDMKSKTSSHSIGTDTLAYMDAQRKAGVMTHSYLLGLMVSVPWGRLEPYGEFRGGLSQHTVKQEYDYQFNRSYHDGSGTYHVVRDSNLTRTYDKTVGSVNIQVGGGCKIWLAGKTAVLLDCLYSFDGAKHILTYENGQDVVSDDVRINMNGLFFGAGLLFNF